MLFLFTRKSMPESCGEDRNRIFPFLLPMTEALGTAAKRQRKLRKPNKVSWPFSLCRSLPAQVRAHSFTHPLTHSHSHAEHVSFLEAFAKLSVFVHHPQW